MKCSKRDCDEPAIFHIVYDMPDNILIYSIHTCRGHIMEILPDLISQYNLVHVMSDRAYDKLCESTVSFTNADQN